MSRWIDAFFAPTAVAVIGASRDPAKVGGSVLANLRSAGFEGRIVPVNARAGTVQGLPAVPSMLDARWRSSTGRASAGWGSRCSRALATRPTSRKPICSGR